MSDIAAAITLEQGGNDRVYNTVALAFEDNR
jgi:hypothetical protein